MPRNRKWNADGVETRGFSRKISSIQRTTCLSNQQSTSKTEAADLVFLFCFPGVRGRGSERRGRVPKKGAGLSRHTRQDLLISSNSFSTYSNNYWPYNSYKFDVYILIYMKVMYICACSNMYQMDTHSARGTLGKGRKKNWDVIFITEGFLRQDWTFCFICCRLLFLLPFHTRSADFFVFVCRICVSLHYVESIEHQDVMIILGQSDDVALGRDLEPAAARDLHKSNYKRLQCTWKTN